MNVDDKTALLITGSLAVLIVAMAVLLLLGKGAFLIAGYNTLPKAQREKYDAKALCRFMGKILLPIGLLMPCLVLGHIYGIEWLHQAYMALVMGLVVFALIYANGGKRYKK